MGMLQMKNHRIIGRKKEMERLETCMEADQAQLIIVYGRRRVGKTFLINEFFANTFAFKLTGTYGQPKRFQLESFAEELRNRTGKDTGVPENWRMAFRLLREYLETLPVNASFDQATYFCPQAL